MHHFSPLLWLCTLSAAALNTFTALDPTGVYQQYLDDLAPHTPAITAFFNAAQDAVYPWTVLPDPVETVVDDLLPEIIPPIVDPAPEPPPEQAPVSPFTTVDATYFDDALFIGDSHTDGFRDYAGLDNATYYTKNGLTVWSIFEKPFIEQNGKTVTLEQALSNQRFAKIYLMLGINELGSGTTESFAEQYGLVIAKIRELQPEALIFIQSIFHTTQEKSDSTFFKNETIDARNSAIALLADNTNVFYLNVNPVFDDDSGALRADYSGDGVHVMAPYYVEWKDYLFDFGVVR